MAITREEVRHIALLARMPLSEDEEIAFAQQLDHGEELINRFESSPGSSRGHCRVCGSQAPGQAPYLPTVSIAAGLLAADPGVKPMLHVFTSSKAPWWEITDNLPQHEKWVPGYEPKQ